ncbi:maleylpyruvate isomerase family mycothiol-dependent enzyme [Streptomyces sp. NBC_01304]|uniref:maleylpyruvate isomerase family mycothiol-dependent enzyme n=1 Tax=Streptomyces sp. NBC_01304 TaxID=2903818 RepID=UPI002E11E16B|nr:maleylpyruvate isomerase N-terminal domain-containing protein [Streptomyces sp. NBC_01304]
MEIAAHLTHLRQAGQSLADFAEAAGPDAPVPTCPDWQVHDLVRHTGAVHLWATAFVAEGHKSPRPLEDGPDLDGAELFAWYRAAHSALVDALEAAPDDLECWAFLPAPSPRAFWARRQAHETTVHRVDAESAQRGTDRATVDAALAADGIDELLRGFHARSRSRVRTEKPRTLRVRATDTDADADAVWTVRLSEEPPVTTRGADGQGGDADCELSGPAARLYLALWNRAPLPHVSGDAELARLWREKSGI